MAKTHKSQVAITSEHIRAARKLHFINHGDGGPLIIIPRSTLPKYFGALDKDGEVTHDNTHYDSVCDGEKLFKSMLGHELLILREDGSSIAFYATKDGGYLLYWVGADTAEAVLAAALDSSYRPTRKDKSWMVPAGGLVLFSAAEHGGKLSTIVEIAVKKGRTHETGSQTPFLFIDLPAGSYEVKELSWVDDEGDRLKEFRGTALHPKGKVEELMVQAYQLSRVGKYEKKKKKEWLAKSQRQRKKSDRTAIRKSFDT